MLYRYIKVIGIYIHYTYIGISRLVCAGTLTLGPTHNVTLFLTSD